MRKIASLKSALYSIGVLMVWLWCAAATCVPVQVLFYAIQRRRWGDLWLAGVLETAILGVAYAYPLYVAAHYEKAAGKRAWFRPISPKLAK